MQPLLCILQRCKSRLLPFVASLLILLVLGCSKGSELVGRWQNTTVQEMVEFKSDNSGIIQGKNLPPLKFTWKETAVKHSYVLDVDFQGQMKKLNAVFLNDTLVLEGEQGKETYQKVTTK